MTAEPFRYALTEEKAPQIGLIVLQSDESIESDFRRLIPPEVDVLVSRVPSDTEVSTETLAAMEAHLTAAAALFPVAARFAAVGYGCTSGTAQIGAAEIARRVHTGTTTRAVTEPLSALIAACRSLGLARLALLSPYVEPVSERLRQALVAAGIETPAFGSFDVAEEARVVRIDGPSILQAAEAIATREKVDGVFLSCTNLRTLDVISTLQDRLGLPVLSSNLVLAWHLLRLAGAAAADGTPGQLLAANIERHSAK
jgi:maleate isomerase